METAKPVVLVADDSAEDLFFIQRALGSDRADCILRSVRDGREAVEYLEGANHFGDREKFPVPHVLVTDLKMPRMNGFEVVAWLRSHPPLATLPVVVLTSSPLDRDRDRAAELGVAAYVLKDVLVENPPAFAEVVRQQLAACDSGLLPRSIHHAE